MRLHTTTTLFPYTTLFRSVARLAGYRRKADCGRPEVPKIRGGNPQRKLLRHTPSRNGGIEKEYVGEVSVADFLDRKSTRLNSRHMSISYAVLCLENKRCLF